MNLRHLKTIVAIADTGAFAAAADRVGLSHSAVSLQVKTLEESLGVALVDRSRRPPVLTDRGLALVEHARRMLEIEEEITALGADDSLIGSLAIGVVPTAMSTIAPPALAAMRRRHPRLRLQVRTGLSADLAQQVRSGEIDAAVATAPGLPLDGILLREASREPLAVIAREEMPETDDAALLHAHPFIWFSRKTWAGQQIERLLAERRIEVQAVMEVESLEAIVALVRHGLGVSVAPTPRNAPPGLRSLPFRHPQAYRTLAVLNRTGAAKAVLVDALLEELRLAANWTPPPPQTD